MLSLEVRSSGSWVIQGARNSKVSTAPLSQKIAQNFMIVLQATAPNSNFSLPMLSFTQFWPLRKCWSQYFSIFIYYEFDVFPWFICCWLSFFVWNKNTKTHLVFLLAHIAWQVPVTTMLQQNRFSLEPKKNRKPCMADWFWILTQTYVDRSGRRCLGMSLKL